MLFMQQNKSNKTNCFLASLFLQDERKNPLRFSKSHLRNLRVSSKSNFHLGFDSEKAKLSKMSKGLNIWLNTIPGYGYLATYLTKMMIKEFKSK